MADLDTAYDGDQRYDDDRDYGAARDRSRSPQLDRDGDVRVRDDPEPMPARNDRDERPAEKNGGGGGDDATNPGSNLFVTGIHPRLTEDEVSRLFEKYGQVEKCNIMRDPHTRESRGFGFVKMVTGEEADAAKEALQGEVYEGRTLSIEKARRARPRTPTPGKYFGPPKREDRPGRGGFRGGDRFDRRDDFGGGRGPYRGYRDRYDDRGSYGRREGRDEYRGYGGRDDRGYGDRRGGGGYGYDRAPRGPPPDAGTYGDAPPSSRYERRSYD